jgi:hypothetical protein
VHTGLILNLLKRRIEAASLFVSLNELSTSTDYQARFGEWEKDTINWFIRHHKPLLWSYQWKLQPVMKYEEMLAFVPTLVPAAKNP